MADEKEKLKQLYENPPDSDDFEIVYEKAKRKNRYFLSLLIFIELRGLSNELIIDAIRNLQKLGIYSTT